MSRPIISVLFVSLLFVVPVRVIARPAAAAELRSLEQVWLRASVAHDRATLDRVLDDGFVHITWRGVVQTKAEAMRAPVAPANVVQTLSHLRIRVYGDTGIVTGLNTVTLKDGSVEARLRFTDVFIRREGLWRVVSAQETAERPSGHG